MILKKYRDRIKLWCDALRSGEYVQGRHFLCSGCDQLGFKHCCLGVACSVYEKETNKKIHKVNTWGGVSFGPKKDVTSLPLVVQKWYGLHSNIGAYWINKTIRNLATDNDTRWLDFLQIADIIEKNMDTFVKSKYLFKKKIKV